jgi:hypothetical protein
MICSIPVISLVRIYYINGLSLGRNQSGSRLSNSCTLFGSPFAVGSAQVLACSVVEGHCAIFIACLPAAKVYFTMHMYPRWISISQWLRSTVPSLSKDRRTSDLTDLTLNATPSVTDGTTLHSNATFRVETKEEKDFGLESQASYKSHEAAKTGVLSLAELSVNPPRDSSYWNHCEV